MRIFDSDFSAKSRFSVLYNRLKVKKLARIALEFITYSQYYRESIRKGEGKRG